VRDKSKSSTSGSAGKFSYIFSSEVKNLSHQL